MAKSTKRKLAKERMQSDILEAARTLFVDHGYESTTLRKIASAVQINPATIYNYYKSKEDLFFDLQEKAFKKFYEEFNEIREGDLSGMVKLKRLGRKYVHFALKNQNLYELMFIMKSPMKVAEQRDPTWKIGGKNYDLLKNTIEECIEEDSIKINDVEAGAFMIWSMIHGLVSLVVMERCHMIPEENLDYVTREAHTMFEKLIQK